MIEGWEVRGVDGLEGGRLEALGGGVWVVILRVIKRTAVLSLCHCAVYF